MTEADSIGMGCAPELEQPVAALVVSPDEALRAPDPESLPPSPISCSGSDPTSSMPSENSIEAQSGRTRVEASATPSVASA
ncbi:hypothetical protein KOW79_007574 [Hemibagrus wyckioides]|uniref:Uncharacterized protein n=1 Tax=Hemibagrus wyckioides TaxID=337641 RepID=A0A9D3NY60_9TELE|nr:hypothetical protein KOW79_007574 [Hemibagrus wyckioides]